MDLSAEFSHVICNSSITNRGQQLSDVISAHAILVCVVRDFQTESCVL
jgi:hypothetical protein